MIMNAPEKIFLTSDGKKSFVFTKKRTDNDGIEYVRTDVFIEKALKWLKENIDRIIQNPRGVCIGGCDREFGNYMKGE